jgi:hypothetical protein
MRARAQSGACAEVQFPDYGTEIWSPGSRNCSRKALIFHHLSCQESENSVWRMRRGAFPDYGPVFCPLAVEIFPGEHCDFSTYVAKRARAQTVACADLQIPDYGTVLWSPGSRNCSRKAENTAISAPIIPREPKLSLVQSAKLQFPDYLTVLWDLAVEMNPGNTVIPAPILPRERTQSRACAEVQFSEYGTVLWSPGSRDYSRRALRFQHLS